VFLEAKMAGKWTKLFSLYMSDEMAALLTEAAESQHMPATVYARLAVDAALRRDGFMLRRGKRPEKRKEAAEAAAA
jgi:hypothetical protein